MHTQTHILSGWCIGNCFTLTARERFLAMLAGFLPDFDGAGKIIDIFAGTEYYHDYHHIIGHNLLAGVIMSVIMTVFSTHRIKAFVLYIGLFHLHLVMDYFGSGPLWEIHYLWPFSKDGMLTDYCWEFFSWQNLLAAFIFIAWTVWIIFHFRRTPLEYIMPSLDKKIVSAFTKRAKQKLSSNGQQ